MMNLSSRDALLSFFWRLLLLLLDSRYHLKMVGPGSLPQNHWNHYLTLHCPVAVVFWWAGIDLMSFVSCS